MTVPINLYGDAPISLDPFGIDVSVQRADELDLAAVSDLAARLRVRGAASALDLACGSGGQAARMGRTGAKVVAVDVQPSSWLAMHAPAVRFVQADLRCLPADLPHAPYDVIVCQRAIHYVRFQDAQAAIVHLRSLLRPDGHLYLSASGLNSELGTAYAGATLAIEQRCAPLAEAVAAKHHVRSPICLYTEPELCRLLTSAGFTVERCFTSPFGNVKAIAF